MKRIPHILGVGLVASVLGCAVDPEPPIDASDESETSGESEQGSDGETTDVDTSSDDASEVGDSTDGDTTTGEPEDPCVGYCQLEQQCDPEFDYAACLGWCGDEVAAAEGTACEPALSEFHACLSGLSCGEFNAIFDDPEGPCFDAVVAFDDLCGELLTCELSGGGDIEGSFCSYQYECHASALHRVECDAEGCVCLIDGVEVGSCDQLYPEICEELDPDPDTAVMVTVERMNECCGWQLEV
ncbi:hypothetical protein ACNOYE_20945 [Nannocystaceae bacterium ST9]